MGVVFINCIEPNRFYRGQLQATKAIQLHPNWAQVTLCRTCIILYYPQQLHSFKTFLSIFFFAVKSVQGRELIINLISSHQVADLEVVD